MLEGPEEVHRGTEWYAEVHWGKMLEVRRGSQRYIRVEIGTQMYTDWHKHTGKMLDRGNWHRYKKTSAEVHRKPRRKCRDQHRRQKSISRVFHGDQSWYRVKICPRLHCCSHTNPLQKRAQNRNRFSDLPNQFNIMVMMTCLILLMSLVYTLSIMYLVFFQLNRALVDQYHHSLMDKNFQTSSSTGNLDE